MDDFLDMALLKVFGEEPEQEEQAEQPMLLEPSSPYYETMLSMSAMFQSSEDLMQELEAGMFENAMPSEKKEAD